MDTSSGQTDLSARPSFSDRPVPFPMTGLELFMVALVIAILSVSFGVFCLGFLPDLMGFDLVSSEINPGNLTLTP